MTKKPDSTATVSKEGFFIETLIFIILRYQLLSICRKIISLPHLTTSCCGKFIFRPIFCHQQNFVQSQRHKKAIIALLLKP